MEEDNIDKENSTNDINSEPQCEEKPTEQQDLWLEDRDSELEEDEQPETDTELKESEIFEAKTCQQTPQASEQTKEGYVLDKQSIKDKYLDYHTFQHTIDSNYLILMAVLSRHKIVDFKKISELQNGYIDMNIRGSKIAVKTTSQEQANQVIEKISDFVDQLSVLKIDLRSDLVNKFVHFQKLTEYFRKDNIVLFASGSKETRTLFMGGHMRPSQLRTHLQGIKAIKVHKTCLRALRNTRSYKIILDEILNMPTMQEQLIKFNQVSFAEIDGRNKDNHLLLSLGTISKRQLTANDYEDFIMKQLRRYYVLTFCFKTLAKKYIEVPKCQKVVFKFINEKKQKQKKQKKNVDMSFMYIIALKQDFYEKRDEIYKHIETIKSRILGVRFFYHLHPVSHDFIFAKETYYIRRFPTDHPYSISFGARTHQDKQFNLKSFYERFLEVLQDKRNINTMIQ